jgi:hypothetical protein
LRTSTTPPATVGVVVGLDVVLLVVFGVVVVALGAVVDGVDGVAATGDSIAAWTISRILA